MHRRRKRSQHVRKPSRHNKIRLVVDAQPQLSTMNSRTQVVTPTTLSCRMSQVIGRSWHQAAQTSTVCKRTNSIHCARRPLSHHGALRACGTTDFMHTPDPCPNTCDLVWPAGVRAHRHARTAPFNIPFLGSWDTRRRNGEVIGKAHDCTMKR